MTLSDRAAMLCSAMSSIRRLDQSPFFGISEVAELLECVDAIDLAWRAYDVAYQPSRIPSNWAEAECLLRTGKVK